MITTIVLGAAWGVLCSTQIRDFPVALLMTLVGGAVIGLFTGTMGAP